MGNHSSTRGIRQIWLAYTSKREVEILKNPIVFWRYYGTYCPNMKIFPQKNLNPKNLTILALFFFTKIHGMSCIGFFFTKEKTMPYE